MKQGSSTPEQALDSTLVTLKEGRAWQSHLSQGLAHVMMRFAEDGDDHRGRCDELYEQTHTRVDRQATETVPRQQRCGSAL